MFGWSLRGNSLMTKPLIIFLERASAVAPCYHPSRNRSKKLYRRVLGKGRETLSLRTIPLWTVSTIGALALALGSPDGINVPEGFSALRAELAERFPVRPATGRLLGFAHSRTPVSAGLAETTALDTIASQLDQELSRRPSSGDRADRGVVDLLEGDVDGAISQLEQARRLAPTDPGVASDLSAAYLTRAERKRNPYDAFRALAEAEHACWLNPDLLAARFNVALANELLHTGATSESWKRYLAADRTSGWAAEAAARLAALAHQIRDRAARYRPLASLAPGAPQGRVDRLVAADPQSAREYVEQDLLAHWGTMARAGEETGARRDLGLARAIGSALARRGERMVADAVAAIDRASAEPAGSRRLRELAEGHAAYGDGLAKKSDYAAALRLYSYARARLAAADSPFSGWAEYQLALVDYQHSGYPEARSRLAGLIGSAPLRYPALRARSLWLRALIAGNEDRDALAGYDQAALIFERLGEDGNVASVLAQGVSVRRKLAEDTRACWRELGKALDRATRFGDPGTWYHVDEQAAFLAEQEGEREIGLAFRDGVVAAARYLAVDSTVAEALKNRAAALRALGDASSALADLREAMHWAGRINDPALQQAVLADIELPQGMLLKLANPSLALTLLQKANDVFHATSYHYVFTVALREKAKLETALGQDEKARQDFAEALAEGEELRGRVPERSRIAYLDEMRSLYDEATLLEIDRRHDAARALDIFERSRARVLLDWLAALPAGGAAAAERERPAAPLSSEQIRAELPPEVVLIEYAVIGQRVYAWALQARHDFALHDLGPAAAVAEEVQAFDRSLEAEDDRFLAPAAALYRLLFAPIAADVADGAEIVVVPSDFLRGIPFAALFDATRHRYLVEDHPVAMAPSATVYAYALSSRTAGGGSAAALIFAAPDFDTRRFLKLPLLPAALTEGRMIRDLLPGSLLLEERAATKDEFLRLAGSFPIVHFAGHSLLDSLSPLSSQLLFARNDRPDDGVLLGREVLGLRFPRTRLVVLGACETGQGDSTHGEDLSLAQIFLTTGVSAVLAQRWSVEDDVARQFFGMYYQHLAQDGDSLRALAAAQAEMLRSSDSKLRYPRAWSGFELVGAAPNFR
jgi:CHAT domain-containing protein